MPPRPCYKRTPLYLLQDTIGDTDSFVPDCSNSSVLALELQQSCSKPSTYGSGHKGGPVLLPGFAIIW